METRLNINFKKVWKDLPCQNPLEPCQWNDRLLKTTKALSLCCLNSLWNWSMWNDSEKQP